MSSSKKKPELKKQEQPAEQQQTPGEEPISLPPEWIALCASCGNEVPSDDFPDALTCTAGVPCSVRVGKPECRHYWERENPGETHAPETPAPLAATPPDIRDRVAALERANIELEKRIFGIERYHSLEKQDPQKAGR